MKIYANGCSFTFGDELADPSISSWPSILSNSMNAELVNDATSGGSNQRTLYKTIKNLNKDFDLYVIAWTSTERYTFYENDTNFEVNFNPQLKHNLYGNKSFYKDWGKVLYGQWHNELYAFKLWLQQIIQLQSILAGKNYLMVNTFKNNLKQWISPQDQFIDSVNGLINFDIMNDAQILDEFKEIQYYVSLIDTSKFYKWNDFFIANLTYQFATGPNGHFLEKGHQHLANLIYNHLCSN